MFKRLFSRVGAKPLLDSDRPDKQLDAGGESGGYASQRGVDRDDYHSLRSNVNSCDKFGFVTCSIPDSLGYFGAFIKVEEYPNDEYINLRVLPLSSIAREVRDGWARKALLGHHNSLRISLVESVDNQQGFTIPANFWRVPESKPEEKQCGAQQEVFVCWLKDEQKRGSLYLYSTERCAPLGRMPIHCAKEMIEGEKAPVFAELVSGKQMAREQLATCVSFVCDDALLKEIPADDRLPLLTQLHLRCMNKSQRDIFLEACRRVKIKVPAKG